jgi:hypothetical protein
MEKDDQLFVHFLSFQPTRQAATLSGLGTVHRPSSRMDEPCVFRATLEVNIPFESVEAEGESTRLKVDGNQVRLVCEDVHDVVTIHRKKSGDRT